MKKQHRILMQQPDSHHLGRPPCWMMFLFSFESNKSLSCQRARPNDQKAPRVILRLGLCHTDDTSLRKRRQPHRRQHKELAKELRRPENGCNQSRNGAQHLEQQSREHGQQEKYYMSKLKKLLTRWKLREVSPSR